MTFVIAFLVALVATIIGTTVFLGRRERARSGHSDDTEGLLIEHQRTAHAAQLRGTYSSQAVHHGTGLISDDLHKHYS
ncbi:hypothetical protein ACFVTF_14810 [Kitasatospora sp. NPDC057940]|uniref:hypothetical protein n=1 Tax=Kitasatospora sp. NPDC057940 TaxID=3346285 RepID=UPI0036D8994F